MTLRLISQAFVRVAIGALATNIALASEPILNDIQPTGAQRGTEVQFTFAGQRLADAQALLLYESGVVVKAITPAGNDAVKVDCVIAADCPLGEHRVRVRTATGISELRTFWIGALPVTAEAEPNSDFTAPQKVPFDTTITGVITTEDVDYFAIELKAGQRLTVEIEGMRLARAMFDPYIAILDSRRFELATSDDSTLWLQDGVSSVIVPADGTYIVQVREASYGGSDACHYRLHIGGFPRPLVVFPPGGKLGETTIVTLLGDPRGPTTMPVTPTVERGVRVMAQDDLGSAPSPLPFRVSSLPDVLETPPQTPASAPAADAAPPAARSPAPPPPLAFSGILEQPGERDVFRFSAAKGQVLDMLVLARRVKSPLDSVLEVFDAEGRGLAGNDDTIGSDAYLRFTAPADGEYSLRVRDHRARGGPTFVYRVEVAPPRPALSLSLERLNGNRPQFLQAIAVPRGNRMAALLRCDRRDVGGAVVVEAPTLPGGVTFASGGAADGVVHAPFVLSAAPDAPLDGGLYKPEGKITTGDGQALAGEFVQVMPLVIAAPNNTVYYQTVIDQVPIAVIEAAPFTIHLDSPPTAFVRDGVGALRFRIERAAGFDADVLVHMLWNPGGISSASTITVPKGQTDGAYPINIAGNAGLATWKIALLAHAGVPSGGEVWVSSELVDLTVADRFLGGGIELAAAQQGQPASVLCKLEHVRPLGGPAKLRLLGLPPKTSAPEIDVTDELPEIVFPVGIEGDAPLGKHSSLLCELVVTLGGTQVVQRFAGGGTLRIDAPPPPAIAEAPAAPAAAPEAAPAPPRPLSRLEQLRKDAAEKPPGGSP